RVLSGVLSVSCSHQDPARGLMKVCLLNNIAIIVSWFILRPIDSLSTTRTLTLIDEHMDGAPGMFLRTTFTSISRANRTDAETLRVSSG
ncbi:hypothetical protein EDB92DRAFT_1776629, partial [Lactarius akahatsu]